MAWVKDNSSFLGFILALFFVVLSLVLYSRFLATPSEILMDNPKDRLIEVQIDGALYTLDGYQNASIDLEPGEYSLKFRGDSLKKIDTVFKLKGEKALINPLRQKYVIYHELFGQKKQRDSVLQNVSSQMDGKTYVGELRETDDLLIEGFYYNVNQSFPDVLPVDSFTVRSKIFRKKDFLDFYRLRFER